VRVAEHHGSFSITEQRFVRMRPPSGRLACGHAVEAPGVMGLQPGTLLNPLGRRLAMLLPVEQTWSPAAVTYTRSDFGAYVPMLRRYLRTLGARADRVDDLVQETFLVALQKQLEVRDRTAEAAWLRGVARHLLLREWRSAAKRREVELSDGVWNEQCGDGDGGDLVDALRECVRKLPARSRVMLQQAYADGGGRAELGRAFGLVADGVKTALRRLRAALKECLQRRLRSKR
jgi:RNA polymerase sigma-70 factor (ECF subfamily)